MNRALTVCIALAASLASALASAEFHLFQIEQVYSNASGSIQFVVLHEFAGANDEHLLTGHSLVSNGPGGTRTFVFPNNLPSRLTAGRRALIATQGFADLGLVAPDYIIPASFVPLTAGTLNYAGVDSVSYASLPTDGTMALTRTGALVTNLATNFAGQSATVNPSAPPPGPPPPAGSNFQGMWAAVPAETGWGINFTHQGDVIFASWFTYDTSGRPWWLTMTALQQPDGSFTGDIDQTRGPPFSASPFLPNLVQHNFIGSGRLTFTDANNGTFAYIVNGFSQTKALTRFVFASPVPTCTFNSPMPMSQALNYQGMWAAAGEGGWGINFTHQGEIIFASWFTYDADGNPWWLTATLPRVGGTTGPYGEPMAGRTYIGSLDATTGPPFNSVPFDSSRVTHTPVGTASLTFAHGASVTFDYTVNGVRQIKVLEPFVFRAPGTVCQ